MTARKKRPGCQICGKETPKDRLTCGTTCWLQRCREAGRIRHGKRTEEDSGEVIRRNRVGEPRGSAALKSGLSATGPGDTQAT